MDRVYIPNAQDETGSKRNLLPRDAEETLRAASESERSSPLHVLDLPQLHTKPSAASILSTLSQLACGLSSWDVNTAESKESPSFSGEGVPAYLTRIISSSLNWIDNNQAKEEIWNSASKRLSERAGRSAMPSLSRTFQIPVPGCGVDERCLDIQVYEPSLTGDNLGHKTWIASYLLAKKLSSLLPRHYSSIKSFTTKECLPITTSSTSGDTRPKILELGAGTGLLGLAVSGLFSVDIHLTDLAPILPNLEHNIQQNSSVARCDGGSVTAGVLDWSERLIVEKDQEKYDIIFAADSLYAPEHSGWLVSTIVNYLRKEAKSRVIIELPLRSDSPYPTDFRTGMEEAGFRMLEDGEDVGYEDWQTSTQEGLEVTCWRSVWAWAPSLSPGR